MVDLPILNCEIFPCETLIIDGWQYRDTPPMLAEFWDELLKVIGEENYRLLTFVERNYPDDKRIYRRGQILISPAGLENIKKRLEKNKTTSKAHGMENRI